MPLLAADGPRLACPCCCAARRRVAAGQGVRALRTGALATVLMTGGVMAYGYLANRYTSEFVPGAGARRDDRPCGRSSARWPQRRRALRSPSVGRASRWARRSPWLAQAATGFSDRRRDLPAASRSSATSSLQDRLSGGPGTAFAGLISQSGPLPDRRLGRGRPAHPRRLRRRSTSTPATTTSRGSSWRSAASVVAVDAPATGAGRATVDAVRHRTASTTRTVVPPDLTTTAPPRSAPQRDRRATTARCSRPSPDEVLRVGHARPTPRSATCEVSSSPGGFVGYVPIQEWDGDWVSRIGTVERPRTTRRPRPPDRHARRARAPG